MLLASSGTALRVVAAVGHAPAPLGVPRHERAHQAGPAVRRPASPQVLAPAVVGQQPARLVAPAVPGGARARAARAGGAGEHVREESLGLEAAAVGAVGAAAALGVAERRGEGGAIPLPCNAKHA